MENYQMFFPMSAPAAAAADQSLPLNMAPNSQVFNKFHGNSVDGFSGFKTKDLIKKPEDHKESVKSGQKMEKKIKKPRYAFQTRSQVDILDDGYRWRKYGQKAVKNNKFPRSYYRCTHEGCNVKKQVQRLTKDEIVVVTTYEGMHTHPIQKPTDNFEHILSQMQIYTPF
ncbi:putative WRKY transcription factor 24 [Hibiscus syriacus]|uniref:WRKY transcription factor 24 n=1 Tax=Hibiscus syriacus TaxID=106335 RepID=A0A6A3BGL5_HIBSY|nr:probable WRKY transcription factor 75 isoform X1 [Hibiscus syriacus]KAE8715864.1 putative WRKY transcription factor 24 [Hibiscus syriacus]